MNNIRDPMSQFAADLSQLVGGLDEDRETGSDNCSYQEQESSTNKDQTEEDECSSDSSCTQ